MRVLVTGAGGFVGSALVRRLAGDADVHALHRPGTVAPEQGPVSWVEQDLTQPLSGALPDRVDAVVHLAQSSRYREFPQAALDVFEVNAGATARLLAYAHAAGAAVFLNASTGSVYARSAAPVSEDSELSPANYYSATKLAAERIVEPYRSLMDVHVVRPFFVYGPGQQPDRFLPSLARRVREGDQVRLAGEEGMRFNPIYVDDAVDVLVALLERKGSATINVAGPEVVTIRRLAEQIGELAGRDPVFETGPPEDDLIASIERMTEVAGAPACGVREGLESTLASAWPEARSAGTAGSSRAP